MPAPEVRMESKRGNRCKPSWGLRPAFDLSSSSWGLCTAVFVPPHPHPLAPLPARVLRPRQPLFRFTPPFAFPLTHVLCSPHQWSTKKYAAVCAQALSSRCPESRHQGGWHSHPRSSARTWRPLARGEEIRNQGWGPTSLPIPMARDAGLLLPTGIP